MLFLVRFFNVRETESYFSLIFLKVLCWSRDFFKLFQKQYQDLIFVILSVVMLLRALKGKNQCFLVLNSTYSALRNVLDRKHSEEASDFF